MTPAWVAFAATCLSAALGGDAHDLKAYVRPNEWASVQSDAGAIVMELCSDRHFVVVSGVKRDVPKNEGDTVYTKVAEELSQKGISEVRLWSHCKVALGDICPLARPFIDRGLTVVSVGIPSSQPPGEVIYTDVRTRCGER